MFLVDSLAVVVRVMALSALWACLPGLLAASFLLSMFGVDECFFAPVRGLKVGEVGVMLMGGWASGREIGGFCVVGAFEQVLVVVLCVCVVSLLIWLALAPLW